MELLIIEQSPDKEKQQAIADSFSTYLDQAVEIRKREKQKEEEASS